MNLYKRKETLFLKRVEALDYDFQNSTLGKMRQSVLNNSLSKKNGGSVLNTLINFNNPDLHNPYANLNVNSTVSN
jgi:hypothetical protein